MPVRIRLSRGGSKKRPYYRIVVADSRRARDGKFIDQVGTYNPMLDKENPDRVKIDIDKAKEWISKGAQPSDRVKLFLSTMGVGEKPVITEKTKKHLPKKKAQEKLAAAKAAAEAPAEAPAEAAPAAPAPAEAPAEAAPAEAPAEAAPAEAPAEAAPAEAPAEAAPAEAAPAEAPAEAAPAEKVADA
jgi:small subunit ribosomal protein S16